MPKRINFRILLFAAVVVGLLAIPIYFWVDATLTGGIRQRGEFLDVNLQALTTFEFDQKEGSIEDVPGKWRALDGKKVILRGEIVPESFAMRGTESRFELVYSDSALTGPRRIQHFVQAQIPPDRVKVLQRFAEKYEGGAVEVRGTLTVRVIRDPSEKIMGIYHIQVEDITPVITR